MEEMFGRTVNDKLFQPPVNFEHQIQPIMHFYVRGFHHLHLPKLTMCIHHNIIQQLNITDHAKLLSLSVYVEGIPSNTSGCCLLRRITDGVGFVAMAE
jgi:hypothetical protein